MERCHYCGNLASGRSLHRDHVIPKSKGGTSMPDNLVWACGACNSTKRDRTLRDARPFLLFRRLGWPTFRPEQIEWMRQKGFDLSELDSAKLYFEEAKE